MGGESMPLDLVDVDLFARINLKEFVGSMP
jgi:hypothetical protein